MIKLSTQISLTDQLPSQVETAHYDLGELTLVVKVGEGVIIGADLLTEMTDNRIPLEQLYSRPICLAKAMSDFEVAVWRSLLATPGVTSYSSLAQQVRRPTAARAVARVMASNRFAYILPCHRVNTKSGQLGGFKWGLPAKAQLQAMSL